jgi:hypothetical protein
MACDICGKTGCNLESLLDIYKTKDIQQICGDCSGIVNRKNSNLLSMVLNIKNDLLKRFIRERKSYFGRAAALSHQPAAADHQAQTEDKDVGAAIRDIAAERLRQISAEGWTTAHDDEHNDRSLAQAASCYVEHYVGRAWLLEDGHEGAMRYKTEDAPFEWPDSWCTTWWRPKNPRRDLVRAAALIAAEIDRIDRAAIAAAPALTPESQP